MFSLAESKEHLFYFVFTILLSLCFSALHLCKIFFLSGKLHAVIKIVKLKCVSNFSFVFQYSEGTIQGSNARCVALLQTLKKVITEYETPEEKEFSRDLVNDTTLYLDVQWVYLCTVGIQIADIRLTDFTLAGKKSVNRMPFG